MSKGLDANINLKNRVQVLKDAGIAFVGRYYNHNNPAKNLTVPEALALSAGGIAIVSIWENGFPNTATYFSFEKGRQDGAAAYAYARDIIDQPMNTPIYPTVDFDASQGEITGPIRAYFSGFNAAFIEQSGGTTIFDSKYQVGVYGSGAVCSYLLAQQLVSYTWLAQSRGWAGYGDFTDWNIKQGPETTIAGVACDSDVSNGHGGGWTLASEGEAS